MRAMGFEVRWRASDRLISVEDYRRAARRRLPQMVWTYVDGGADDMVSVADNRQAFGRWSLRTKVLAGHERRDLSTTVAGVPLELPVLLAPTGLTGLTYWAGDIVAARAAERHGTRYMLSTVSSWSIEEVAPASSVSHFFQLYPRSGEVGASLMRRAWNSGVRVLVVTVDVPVRGNREGEHRHGLAVPPVLTPGRLLSFATHPGWAYGTLRYRRIAAANLAEDDRAIPGSGDPGARSGVSGPGRSGGLPPGGLAGAIESVDTQTRQLMQPLLNWDDLAWIREHWDGPLYLKGILDPGDAKRAVSLGLDGVIVSNHGGRQLDFAPAALDALPEIVAAVGDRAEILFDGGVRRGTDIVKALALGARAVLIGRPYLYGMAVRGERGVVHVLDILRNELDRALTLMGAQSIHALDPTWLIPRETRENGRNTHQHVDQV